VGDHVCYAQGDKGSIPVLPSLRGDSLSLTAWFGSALCIGGALTDSCSYDAILHHCPTAGGRADDCTCRPTGSG
jgi:hypothetical protein